MTESYATVNIKFTSTCKFWQTRTSSFIHVEKNSAKLEWRSLKYERTLKIGEFTCNVYSQGKLIT